MSEELPDSIKTIKAMQIALARHTGYTIGSVQLLQLERLIVQDISLARNERKESGEDHHATDGR